MKKDSPKKAAPDREFAVILEKVYSEIKTLGEGQSALSEKLDGITGMVAKNTEDISWQKLELGMKYDKINTELNKINGKLVRIEDNLKASDKRISHLETAPR